MKQEQKQAFVKMQMICNKPKTFQKTEASFDN